jgi:hypothetical protein
MDEDAKEMLSRIDERTKYIQSKLTTHCKQLDDHNKRINKMENRLAYMAGIGTVVLTILSYVIKIKL